MVSEQLGPLLDERGLQIGVRGREHDITARKQAELALRQNEERLRFLAEAGALLSASLDYATRLQSVARLAVPRIADWCTVDVIGRRWHAPAPGGRAYRPRDGAVGL